jgi:hypothetical protein
MKVITVEQPVGNLIGRMLTLFSVLGLICGKVNAVERLWVGPDNGEISQGEFWDPPSYIIVDESRVYVSPDSDDVLTIPRGSVVQLRSAFVSTVKVMSGATIDIAKSQLNGAIRNYGLLRFQANGLVDFGLGSRLENEEDGIIEFGENPFNSTTPATIVNRGHLLYTGSTGIEFSGHHTYVFENYGLVETTDGEMSFSQNQNPNDGAINSAWVGGRWRSSKSGRRFSFWNATLGDPIVEGPGELVFYQGTVNLNNSLVTKNIVVDGAALTGENTFRGALTVRSSFGIEGVLRVPPKAELRIEGPGVYPSVPLVGTIINEGRMVIPEQNNQVPLDGRGGGIDNRPSGIIELYVPYVSISITNRGAMYYRGKERWYGGQSGVVLNNYGSVEFAHAGILNGSCEFYAGSKIRAHLVDDSSTRPWMLQFADQRFPFSRSRYVLNGVLEVDRDPGFRPVPGTRYPVIVGNQDMGVISGRFENPTTAVVDGIYFEIQYQPMRVELISRTAPVAKGDKVIVAANNSTNVPVLVNDTDADGDQLSIVNFSQGDHGKVAANGDGTLRYTPEVNYLGGDVFTYTVADVLGALSTAIVEITVLPPAGEKPEVTTPPVSRVVGPGSAVELSVSATSGSGLSYQWRFNGQPVAGATGSTYTIPAAVAANAGRYTVVVTNEAGAVESAPANVSLFDVATFVGTIITGPVGASYRVEYREALAPENAWQPVTTLTLAVSPTVWIDEESPAGTRRFYRAILLNP